MGWLHDYQEVNRFASPRSVEQGTRVRNKAPVPPGRFTQVDRVASLLHYSPKEPLRSPRSPQSLRADPSTRCDAGAPSFATTALVNHDRSPRGPCRPSPRDLEEFVTSPRRQLQRGASCPPRTDPITHSCALRTDPLSLRSLEYGHLATRQRSLRRVGFTSATKIGKLDLKTHEQTSLDLQSKVRALSPSVGLNSSQLAGEEDLLPPKMRPLASDKEVSARYTNYNNRRNLTFIDLAVETITKKGSNPSLATSCELLECFGKREEPLQRTSPPASDSGRERNRSSVGPDATTSSKSTAPAAPAQPSAAASPAAASSGHRRPSGTSVSSDLSTGNRPKLKLFNDPLR